MFKKVLFNILCSDMYNRLLNIMFLEVNSYAIEALKAVIDFLFDIGFVKITADHYSDNLASGKVMQKQK